MRCLLIIAAIFAFKGCVPNIEKAEKLYLKEVTTPELKLEWYYHSTLTTTTPDYVVAESNGVLDTICISDNIASLVLTNSSVEIGFYGTPKRYGKPISINRKTFLYDVMVDTLFINEDKPFVRKFYKKSQL